MLYTTLMHPITQLEPGIAQKCFEGPAVLLSRSYSHPPPFTGFLLTHRPIAVFITQSRVRVVITRTPGSQ